MAWTSSCDGVDEIPKLDVFSSKARVPEAWDLDPKTLSHLEWWKTH
jgi:hypothetical protein